MSKPKKGGFRTKGQPALYSEMKKLVTLSMTPTALSGLDERADQMGLSRSEFVEQIGRGVIPVGSKISAPPEKDIDPLGKN
jgi:hypothetical protein